MEKLISIIVPVYNVGELLYKCINSIRNQSYTNLEILLIDDGSTDCSGELCEVMAKKDNRIKVIHKKNGGLSSARNLGVKVSKGDFVQFIDSDDWISPNMIEELYKAINYNLADIAICGIIMSDNINETPMEWYNENTVLSMNQAMDALIENHRLTSHAWNKLFKRSIIEGVPFPEGKLYEDVRMMHFVFEKCTRVAIVKEKYYYYFQRNNSITNVPILKNKLELVEAFIDRFEYMKDKKTSYKEILQSQIAMTFSLSIVQNKYEREQFNSNRKKINNIFNFIMNKDVKRSVKKIVKKKDLVIYYIAIIFKTKANSIYRLMEL